MTAVYEETLESGRPVQRLVVTDVQTPSNYEVLSAAGRDVGRSCFGPEKQRLLFEDNSESTAGSQAPIKLLDLDSREVRNVGATGTLKGCVWRADGSGFYYAAASLAGLTVSTFYDLETDETEIFAQSESGATVLPYGRKGRDSILVQSNDSLAPGPQDRPAFYFVDADTGEYLTQIENEHLRFVPREDPERGGWKQGAFRPTYSEEKKKIAFQFDDPENMSNIAVVNIEGGFFEIYGASREYVDTSPRWGPGEIILFDRRPKTTLEFKSHRIMIINAQTENVRILVSPETIDRAVGLRAPDY